MSVSRVKEAMKRFLKDERPQVLCISGKWGSGKTYAWNEALHAASKDELPISNYAYVSMFGLKEAGDIMQTAYINSKALSRGTMANLDLRLAIATGTSIADMKRRGKKLIDTVTGHASIPWVSGLGGVARAVMSALTKDTIVCIDDIERKGSNVTVKEIMGVIAQLRDERGCKVVLILNQDSLDAEDRKDFEKYGEKAIDITFHFIPTAEESAAIAFADTDELSETLREASIELGITNIRVMMKTGGFARELTDLLKDIDAGLIRGIMRTLVLLTWSILSTGDETVPTMTYLLERRIEQRRGDRDAVFTPSEIAWGAVLDDFGFTHADEFDHALVDELKRGYFNWDNLKQYVEKGVTDAQGAQALAEIEAAWFLYRSTFSNNAAEVADAMYKASVDNLKYLSPINLNGTVSILKEIGAADKATDLLTKYIEARGDENIFAHRESPFGDRIDDPEVVAAFDAKEASKPRPAPPSPFDAAKEINSRSWGSWAEEALGQQSVDDFERLFMEASASEMPSLVKAALSFYRISNATVEQRAISDRARDALIRIGRTSKINRLRVSGLGITIPDDAAMADQAGEGEDPH